MTLWTTTKADQIFSKWIRERDKKCFFCPNKGSQNSHFWGRGNSSTRYDPENCDGICGGCHMRHEGNKQGLYREKKLAQLGKKRYEALEKRAHSIMKRRDAIIACMNLLKDYTPL
jgi:5-methylcytosine-specific restriction endonuclease McrA